MYRLIDAESYRDQKLLVVGGGDSAVEAAIGLAQQPGNEVTLSYRRDKLVRIKKKNEERLAPLLASGRVKPLFGSQVAEITPGARAPQGGRRRSGSWRTTTSSSSPAASRPSSSSSSAACGSEEKRQRRAEAATPEASAVESNRWPGGLLPQVKGNMSPRGFRAVVLALAAASSAAADVVLPKEPSLDVDPASPPLVADAKLRQRLAADAHSYFRYVNGPFREVLCRKLVADARRPSVTLHGDPHVEQYAVTDKGRGLADFDDSTVGPAVLDLVRFATSLRLAMGERGWGGADEMVRGFLESYARALRSPKSLPPEPRVVARVRARFDRNRTNALARAEALMEALPPEKAPSDEILARTARWFAQVSGQPEASFKVKRFGAHRTGIGSATDEKYLLRIEGDTPAPEDDVILEVKKVRPIAAGECVRSEPGHDRILRASSQLAYQPFVYAGGGTLPAPAVGDGEGPGEGHSFWFHAWTVNYADLDLGRDLDSAAELDEIARDVGFQLGRGHAGATRDKDSKTLRGTLLAGLPGENVPALSLAMAQATADAWRRYRERLPD